MNLNKTSYTIFRWTFVTISAIVMLSACKKEVEQKPEIESLLPGKQVVSLSKKVNPFSHENIKKARNKLTAQNRNSVSNSRVEEDRLYTYIQFDPATVTGDLLKQLEEDTTIQILNFPFANGEIYNDEFAIDEAKANALADGKLYAVAKKNTAIENILKTTSSISPVVLDELYLPDEEDTTLQIQAFVEAGYTEEQINQLRICLFKRPTGFVRYLDTETGGLRNVPGMQVWGLVFGIPLHTTTDDNGYYRFPWRFVAGTIMGTKAKNSRVNIKPFNTQGAWIITLPIQFIVGSIHIHGWVGACQMRNDVNFEFRDHQQNRYWAQLMHSVYLHDQYTAADNITRAPGSLTMYAHWADRDGNASAPMLGHLSGLSIGSIALQYLADLLGGATHNDFPSIFNLLTGLLPDITIRTNGTTERRSYSARLMQTAFHELGHGSHFQRAGQGYWYDLIRATLRSHPDDQCGGGYGCGQNADDGNVAIAESWAEFIGTNHALRLHPNGEKASRWAGSVPPNSWGSAFITNRDALEWERWFFNDWIASGIYNDLMDVVNADPTEFWDRTGGLTIQQLYDALGPDIDFFCDYEWEIINRYGLNVNEVDEIFWNNGAGGCL